MDFRTIQGNPVDASICPFIAIVVNDAHATVNSIYRGDDAATILHKHGKHTQRELYDTLPAGTANPPGFSTHELKSDGVAYPWIPRGHSLLWWMQGFDVNDSDVPHVKYQALTHGWHLFQPYPGGVEFHHLNFAAEPKTRNPMTLSRIARIRRTYLRS